MKHSIPFVALALVAALLFPACGDKAGGGGAGGGGSAGAEGTWELDISAFKETMQAEMDKEMEGKSEQEAAMMKAMLGPILSAFDKASVTVEINGDKTWSGSMSMPDMGKGGEVTTETVKGTWTQDGDQITFTTTHEDGKATDDPDTRVGTLKGDELHVTEKDAGSGPNMTMVMRRK